MSKKGRQNIKTEKLKKPVLPCCMHLGLGIKVLMQEKTEFCLVGNDDSGPEDVQDDLDLECGSPPSLRQSGLLTSHYLSAINLSPLQTHD